MEIENLVACVENEGGNQADEGPTRPLAVFVLSCVLHVSALKTEVLGSKLGGNWAEKWAFCQL